MPAAITTRDVTFQTTIGPARGYVAMPEEAARSGPAPSGGEARFPGMLVIHEWWGVTDHIRDVARRLAAEGYVTLVPDLYDGQATKSPAEAERLMAELPPETALAIMIGALESLDQEYAVDRIGVIGFCMGGGLAMLLACHTARMAAVVAFYGSHPGEEELARVQAPILFIGAENDAWITREKIEEMRTLLTRRHKAFEIEVPPGTSHAFFNDSRPDVYNAEAASAAWKRVRKFLERSLKLQTPQPAGVNPTWPPDMRS